MKTKEIRKELTGKDDGALATFISEQRETLRTTRFNRVGQAGARTVRKNIARALTALTHRRLVD